MKWIKPIMITIIYFIVQSFQPGAEMTVMFACIVFYLLGSFVEGIELGYQKQKLREQFETALCDSVGYKQGSAILTDVNRRLKAMESK